MKFPRNLATTAISFEHPTRTTRLVRIWRNLPLSLSTVACAASFMSSTAIGFEGYEHRTMANLAFQTAVAIVQSQDSPPGLRDAMSRLNDQMCSSRGGTEVLPSYGDITQCVDALLSPEYLFARTWERRAKNSNPEEGFRRTDGFDADWNEIGYTSKDCQVNSLFDTTMGGRYFRASHNNHSHFQSHLLVSIQMNHFLATSLAKSGRLHMAMAANAISDHYLHDFFAPGHLATTRDDMTDVFANQFHDHYNQKGAYFMKLYSRDQSESSSSNIRNGLEQRILDQFGAGGNSQLRAAFLRKPAKLSESGCSKEPNKWPIDESYRNNDHYASGTVQERDRVLEGQLNDIISLLKNDIHAHIKSDSGPPEPIVVRLRGDDLLWREWDGCLIGYPDQESARAVRDRCVAEVRESLTQRLTILIANVISIMEVLDGYREFLERHRPPQPQASPVGTTLNAIWPGKKSIKEDDMTYAALGVGMYVSSESIERNTRSMKYVDFDTPRDARNVGWGTPVLSVGIARESMTSNDVGRWKFSVGASHLERIDATKATPMATYLSVNGIYYQEGSRQGFGGEIGLGKIVSDAELDVGFFARRVKHIVGDQGATRNGFGVRVGMGVSSMLGLYVGAGKDYGYDSHGVFRRGNVVFGGISVQAPVTRIPGVSKFWRKLGTPSD